MALGELLSYGARRAVANAPVAAGVLGTAGFVGARGDPGGVPAGIFGSAGGGARGAFSGGIIGSLLGVGAVAGALAVPGVRSRMGRMLHTAMSSGPARKLEGVMRMAGTESHLNIANAISTFRGLQPQVAAAEFTSLMLKNKQRALMMGTVGGGFVGALAGIPLGATRSAYVAGRRRSGPMGVQG